MNDLPIEQKYEKMVKKAYAEGYVKGLIVGIKRYAWQKGNTQVVGVGTETLTEALGDVKAGIETAIREGKKDEDVVGSGIVDILRRPNASAIDTD